MDSSAWPVAVPASELRIHFQATTLVEAADNVTTPPPSDEPVTPRECCALTELEVGETPLPAGSGSTVARMPLQIFPCIFTVKFTSREWEDVAGIINDFRRFETLVHPIGEVHQSHMFNDPR